MTFRDYDGGFSCPDNLRRAERAGGYRMANTLVLLELNTGTHRSTCKLQRKALLCMPGFNAQIVTYPCTKGRKGTGAIGN